MIDEKGKDITDYDVRGELCVRGPTVIKGYFNNPKANAESYDEEGYFKTGDVMYCDSKTKLWYIVDRKKVCRNQIIARNVLFPPLRMADHPACPLTRN